GLFEPLKNGATANNAAWACSLGPGAVKDMDRAVRLARWAAETHPEDSEYRDTLGAVLYRAGDMEGTIRELSESMSPNAPTSTPRSALTVLYDRLFLAMALHRSKRADEARELLEAAINQLDLNRQGHAGAPASLA